MKTNKITAVPRLRFPEFKGDIGWKGTTLENIAELNPSNSGLPNKFIYIDLESVQDSRLLNRKEVTAANAPSRAQRLLEYGDVLFQTVRPYQKNNYFFLLQDTYEYVASTGYAQLRAFESASYLNQYIYNERFVSRVLEHCAGGNYPAINSKNLAKLAVEIPTVPEQQKIADCLSSLDDLIDAENEQLNTLKEYKAGLLQQLFPAEGETMPKRRFTEFEGDGDWEEVSLIDVTNSNIKWSFIGGPFGSNLKASDYTSDGVRVIQLQNIGDGEFVDDSKIYTSKEKADELLANNIYPNDIIMSKMGDPVGRACIIPDTHERYVMCSDGIRLVVDEEKYSKYFIYSLINSPFFRSLIESKSTGSTRKRIGLSHLKDIQLLAPKLKEQQKIANCLSSLDNLIQAKDEKIKTLKEHKQGLMQQLFPVMDGE